MAYNSTRKMLTKVNGISLYEVSKCLGAPSRDLGTLCTYPNIRMWSKHKPIRSSSIVPLTDAQKRALNYGLKPPQSLINGTSNFRDLLDENLKWTYEKPRGVGNGYNEPYRLSDFVSMDVEEGYCHDCVDPPIKAGEFNYSTIVGSSGSLLVTADTSTISGAIQYSDLGSYDSWYLGMVVFVTSHWDNNEYMFFKTSDYTLATAPHFNFSKEDADAILQVGGEGTYDFFIFLIDRKGTTDGKNVLHLYNPTASGKDYPNPNVMSALFNDLSQIQGKLTVRGGGESGDPSIHLSIEALAPGNAVTSSIPFPPDSDRYFRVLTMDDQYQYNDDGTITEKDTSGFYLSLTSSAKYTVSIQCTVTNSNSTSLTITKSSLRIRISHGLSGTISTDNPLMLSPANLSSSTRPPYTEESSVTIPGGESRTFTLALPDNSMIMNASGVSDPNISTNTKSTVAMTLMKYSLVGNQASYEPITSTTFRVIKK